MTTDTAPAMAAPVQPAGDAMLRLDASGELE